MNPVTIIFIIFTTGLLFYVSVSFISRFAKKKKEILVRKLCQQGADQNLIFCSQEIFENKVMGFDGIHRKIMILEKIKNIYHTSTISLDDVHDCRLITKHDSTTEQNDSANDGTQDDTLELFFEFNNDSEPALITFWNSLINSKNDFAFLKAKAECWCTIFSKMLNRQIELRA